MPRSKGIGKGKGPRPQRIQASCLRCRSNKRKCNHQRPKCSQCLADVAKCTYITPHGLTVKRPSSGVSIEADVRAMIESRAFFNDCFDVFLEDIDWIMDLLKDTRLHRIREMNRKEIDPALSRELIILQCIIVAIVAQMCPSSFRTIRAMAFPPGKGIALLATKRTDEIAETFYRHARATLDDHSHSGSYAMWPAENFAAVVFLTMYEKNSGRMEQVKEARHFSFACLEQAGLTDQRKYDTPRFQQRSMPEEHILLAYRIFWLYFEKDWVTALHRNVNLTAQYRTAQQCLKHSEFHCTIDNLHAFDNVGGGSKKGNACICGKSARNLSLSKYSGLLSRLSSIRAQIGARLDIMKDFTLIACFNAQDLMFAVEGLLDEIEMRLGEIQDELHRCREDNNDCPSDRQMVLLEISLASVRKTLLQHLMSQVGDRILQIDAGSDEFVEWLLLKRRCNASIELIQRAARIMQLSNPLKASWIMFTKFIADHLQDMATAINAIFAFSADGMIKWLRISTQMKGDIADYLRSILEGRNILIRSANSNDLLFAKDIAANACMTIRLLFEHVNSQGQELEMWKLSDTNVVVRPQEFNRNALINAVVSFNAGTGRLFIKNDENAHTASTQSIQQLDFNGMLEAFLQDSFITRQYFAVSG